MSYKKKGGISVNIKDFKENIENTLQESSIDSEAGILRRVCVMRSQSRNNRVYSADAMEDILNELQKKN